ncbi:MAG: hypothetical protein OHK0038_24770 [Flammeovirgaceae bacterium]
MNPFIQWLYERLESIKKWNWKVLLICYVTAFVFWIFHQLNAEHTATISLPIRIVYEQDNVVAIVTPPEVIHINVSGYGWNLLGKSIALGVEPLYIEMEDPIKHKHITSKGVLPMVNELLKDMKVNYIVEDSIYFYYDTIATKLMKVELDTSLLTFEEGFRRVSDYQIEPDSVKLIGPSSILKEYTKHLLLCPNVKNIDENINGYFSLTYQENRFVTVEPKNVKLSFQVEAYTKQVVPVKLTYVNFPKNANLVVENGDEVRISFWTLEKDSLSIIDTMQISVDYQYVNWKDSTIRPLINVPDHYLDTKLYPSTLKLSPKK